MVFCYITKHMLCNKIVYHWACPNLPDTWMSWWVTWKGWAIMKRQPTWWTTSNHLTFPMDNVKLKQTGTQGCLFFFWITNSAGSNYNAFQISLWPFFWAIWALGEFGGNFRRFWKIYSRKLVYLFLSFCR